MLSLWSPMRWTATIILLASAVAAGPIAAEKDHATSDPDETISSNIHDEYSYRFNENISNWLPYNKNTNPTDAENSACTTDAKVIMSSMKSFGMHVTRKGTPFALNLWPKTNGVAEITYLFDKSNIVPKSDIRKAMDHIEEHTCIKFVEKADSTWFGYRIHFKGGTGCQSSWIGRQVISAFFGGQSISMSSGCGSRGTIVHEISHALGLFHEQSRSDRNKYVKISYKNVNPSLWANLFKFFFTRNYDTLYDHSSVMQYDNLDFSINGGTTIATLDPFKQGLIALSRTGFSFMDKLQLKHMYKCSEHWMATCSITTDPCQNLGYIGPKCVCVCPEGTTGDNCETKGMEYLDALVKRDLPLNGEITTASTFSSPVNTDNKAVAFTKLIKAPKCHTVQLEVKKFDLLSRFSSKACDSEGVEIRLNDDVLGGTWYCGTEISVGTTFASEKDTMVVFYSRDAFRTSNGFEFQVSFVPVANCT